MLIRQNGHENNFLSSSIELYIEFDNNTSVSKTSQPTQKESEWNSGQKHAILPHTTARFIIKEYPQ